MRSPVLGDVIKMIDCPRVLGGPAALPLLSTAATLLLTATVMAQQGPTAAPPAGPATHVESGELHESRNGRVSQGPPIGATPEVDGWGMGAAMPLARSEHSIAEFNGKIWVLGGYPPGRLPSNLVQIYDPATSRWSLGPSLPTPIHHTHVAAVGGKIYLLGGEIEVASTGRPEKFVAEVWILD